MGPADSRVSRHPEGGHCTSVRSTRMCHDVPDIFVRDHHGGFCLENQEAVTSVTSDLSNKNAD